MILGKIYIMIAKACPKCDQQIPVACKACPCGHSFARKPKSLSTSSSSPQEEIRRRTQRVKREKPDYYDSLEYDKQSAKRQRTRYSECDLDEESSKKSDARSKKKKIKRSSTFGTMSNVEEDEEDDLSIYNNLSPEKQEQCTIILAELNRKLKLVTWKPPNS